MKNLGWACLVNILILMSIQVVSSGDGLENGVGYYSNSSGLMPINSLKIVNRSYSTNEELQAGTGIAEHGYKQSNDVRTKEDKWIHHPGALSFRRNLSISGTVFNDSNGNGFRDIGEPIIGGRVIRLMRLGSAEIKETRTDSYGHYSFGNLTTGNYTIKEDYFPGWNQTAPGDKAYTLILTDKDANYVDFGNFQPLKKHDEFSYMHFTTYELKKMQEQYEKAPKVPISPQFKYPGPEGGNVLTFCHISRTPQKSAIKAPIVATVGFGQVQEQWRSIWL